ncbi:MAG: response regulator [SAR324 cluster bacterium]|nr:response regulator [SAR324 cluster bacterium]
MKTTDNDKYRLLIVEDDTDICKALCIELENTSFHASFAHDATAAIDMLGQNKTDLILLDIALSHSINGLELLDHIKKHPVWQTIPVVMLSARSDSEAILKALKLGAIDYIPKPYDGDQLIMRLIRAVRPKPLSLDERSLHVTLLKQSLLLWKLTTGTNKQTLIEQSSLWSLYMDNRGVSVSRTFNRYLNLNKLPKNPDTVRIIKTAEFVLSKVDDQKSELALQIIKNLEGLRRFFVLNNT